MARKKPAKDKSEKSSEPEEAAPTQTGASSVETAVTRTFDDYECSGNVMSDFPGLCALLDIKNIPILKPRSRSSSQETTTGGRQSHKKHARDVFKPQLHVELENGDPYLTSSIKIFGWTVDEPIVRVLSKIISSSTTLQSVYFWQAGLTEPMVITLVNAVCVCTSLRIITLEGNPLVDNNLHLLLCEGSALTQLNLRNNQIEDEGARLLGAGLSTSTSANWNLNSLNLAFNHIGDVGAGYIANSSAAVDVDQSCAVKLPSDQLPSLAGNASLNSNKGENKNTAKKRESSKPDGKRAPAKDQKCLKKSEGPDVEEKNHVADQEHKKQLEMASPLLNESVQHRDGELLLPGNNTLVSLNLAGNRITELSLPRFLTSLQMQDGGKGLLRLCLQRNHFAAECESYVKLKELMALRDPLNKNSEEPPKEDVEAEQSSDS
ncbi:leucine-rich repeat-containing protein 71 isoform X2 [Festucalex cinctus]